MFSDLKEQSAKQNISVRTLIMKVLREYLAANK
jgi:hypothetical protein